MKDLENRKKSIPTYETKEFTATVIKVGTHKEVKVNHLAYFHNEMENFREGDAVGFIITNVKKRLRTLSQNSFMHCYFTLIAKMTDNSMADIKHWAKGKCLSSGITEIFGDKIRKVKDTSKLTIGEMIEFLARVECVSGYPMPDPRPFNLPVTWEEFKRLKYEEIERYKSIKGNIKLK